MFQSTADMFVPETRGRRLYISRMLHGSQSKYVTRVMSNEAEFADALAKLGFEIIEPQTLSIDQQISLFSSAEIIVAP